MTQARTANPFNILLDTEVLEGVFVPNPDPRCGGGTTGGRWRDPPAANALVVRSTAGTGVEGMDGDCLPAAGENGYCSVEVEEGGVGAGSVDACCSRILEGGAGEGLGVFYGWQ